MRWRRTELFRGTSNRRFRAVGDEDDSRSVALGIECDEVIHSILDIMYGKAPYTVIQRAMHIHPTVSELIPTMLGELKPLEAKNG